jgi:hypothetical protein
MGRCFQQASVVMWESCGTRTIQAAGCWQVYQAAALCFWRSMQGIAVDMMQHGGDMVQLGWLQMLQRSGQTALGVT